MNCSITSGPIARAVDRPTLMHTTVTCSLRLRHAGCTVPESAPADGDLHLVSLDDAPSMTQACDQVHCGAVEVFNRGRWGAVCGTQQADIACRQLGFPFGRNYAATAVRLG